MNSVGGKKDEKDAKNSKEEEEDEEDDEEEDDEGEGAWDNGDIGKSLSSQWPSIMIICVIDYRG